MSVWRESEAPIALLSVLCVAVFLSGCDSDAGSGAVNTATPNAGNPFANYQSREYAGLANWLCHPRLDSASDVCDKNLDTLAVSADGSSEVLPHEPAANPEVDCFYVYPTTSADLGNNSDFNPDAQELQTTVAQAARYNRLCRVFAPVYRQRTLTILAVGLVTSAILPSSLTNGEASPELAYVDVLDAFSAYMAQDNGGRGFVLVGHSQGSFLLQRLIAEQIETQPYLSQRMIAAHLIGANIAVPRGADVGGAFASTPACRHAQQTGCVVAYSSSRQGDPELGDPRFGVAPDSNAIALCTHPGALSGGAAALDIHVPFVLPPVYQLILLPRGSGGAYANPAQNLLAGQPFYSVPGQITGECVINSAGTSYLQVRINSDASDPRADDYPGEF